MLIFIILARILSPESFGLMAILSALSAFSQIFVEMGIGSALVHLQKANRLHYSTAFSFNMILGVCLTAGLYLSASLIAVFYELPELDVLVKVFSLIFIINALSIVPKSIIEKKGDFQYIAAVELVSVIVSSLLAIYLAMQGAGVWALVVMAMLNSGVRATLFIFIARWSIRLRVGFKEFLDIWKYIQFVIPSRIMDFGVNNLATLIIGKVASSSDLGNYNIAYRIMTLPRDVVGSTFNRVLISKYAKHQNEPEIIKRLHLKTSKLVALVSFPVSVGAIVLADVFVQVVLGDKWEGAVPILQLVALITFLQPIGVLNSSIYLSQGKTKLQLYAGLFIKGFTICAVVIGAFWGIYGILYSLIISMAFTMIPAFYFSGSVIGLGVNEIFKNLISVLVPIMISGLIVWHIKQEYFFHNSMFDFFVMFPLYVAVSVLLLFFSNKQFIKENLFKGGYEYYS